MDYREMNQILADLDQAMLSLENAYIEAEGECTEQTEQMETEISGLKELLTTEGVDFLGGWLKAKEDRKKALKAEKDYLTRQMAALDETIEFIKGKVNEILIAAGKDRVKGDRGYSFATATSVKTDVDKETLKEMFQEAVESKLRSGRKPVIPADVTITLGASVKAVPEGAELPAYYTRTETPSVRFTKPRAAKEA